MFLFSERASAPVRACSHCFSLFPKAVEVHYNFFPPFLPVPLTLWEAGGSTSCTLLHLWYNLVILWGRARCLLSTEVGMLLKTRHLFSSSYKPFDHLFLSQLSQSFLHLCPCFLKSPYNLCHSFEILLAAAPLKQGFLLSQTMFSWQVKISGGPRGLYVISICIQTAGLNFTLFAFNNKLLFFSCKLQIIKTHQTLSIETKYIVPYQIQVDCLPNGPRAGLGQPRYIQGWEFLWCISLGATQDISDIMWLFRQMPKLPWLCVFIFNY